MTISAPLNGLFTRDAVAQSLQRIGDQRGEFRHRSSCPSRSPSTKSAALLALDQAPFMEWQFTCQTAPKCAYVASSISFSATW